MELLTEKIISSAGGPLTPGECMRRVMEALASSILINGPGLLDPCEKEPEDALATLSKQQREDVTVSAQMFLRFIAFRQIHKVLGMEPLPPPKFVGNRNWRFNRKRRRSGTEGADNEGKRFVRVKKAIFKHLYFCFSRWQDGQEGGRQRGQRWRQRGGHGHRKWQVDCTEEGALLLHLGTCQLEF